MQYTLRAIRTNSNKTQSEVAKDLGIRVETNMMTSNFFIIKLQLNSNKKGKYRWKK